MMTFVEDIMDHDGGGSPESYPGGGLGKSEAASRKYQRAMTDVARIIKDRDGRSVDVSASATDIEFSCHLDIRPSIRLVVPENNDCLGIVELDITVCRADGSLGAELISDDGSETFRKLAEYAKLSLTTAAAQGHISYWFLRPDRVSPYQYVPPGGSTAHVTDS